jgi:hypothetical protein
MPKNLALFMKRNNRFLSSLSLISCLLVLGLTSIDRARASDAPPALTNLLTEIDAEANQNNVKGVMQHYSSNFTDGDGLNRQTWEKALTLLWQRYPKLHYSTSLRSWKSEGNTTIAETVTKITGLAPAHSNNLALNSTIVSRQRVIDNKIVYQDILSEHTQETSGNKPPQVDLQVPSSVKTGQKFNFDAIVAEPLGDDFLLGSALEEPIQPEQYLNFTPINLELLNSGGLFKIGKAPIKPGKQWVSAVILRGEGMTIITQRLQVVKK